MYSVEKFNNVYIIYSDFILSEDEFEKLNKIKKIERLVYDEELTNSGVLNVVFSYGLSKFLERFEEYEHE